MQEEYKRGKLLPLAGENTALQMRHLTPYQLECLKHPFSREEEIAQTQRILQTVVEYKENIATGWFGDEDMVARNYKLKDCKVTEIVRQPDLSSIGICGIYTECVATPVSDSNQDIPDLTAVPIKVYFIRWTTTLHTLQDGDICSVIVGKLYHSKSKGYYIIARYGKCEASDKRRH